MSIVLEFLSVNGKINTRSWTWMNILNSPKSVFLYLSSQDVLP